MPGGPVGVKWRNGVKNGEILKKRCLFCRNVRKCLKRSSEILGDFAKKIIDIFEEMTKKDVENFYRCPGLF